MAKTLTTRRSGTGGWAGYAAAVWAIAFAIRGVYWALGGTTGLGTLSQGIQQAATDSEQWLFTTLWVTVALEIAAALLALALVRPWGQPLPHRLPFVGGKRIPGWLLLLLAWGAGTLLAGHGVLFIGFSLLAVIDIINPASEVRWYLLFWGPWFTIGGLLFMAAGWSYLHRAPSSDQRLAKRASLLGALGGITVAVAPVVPSLFA